MASVNQEYAQAFRTKSYTEMWGKLIESQVATSTSLNHPVSLRAHLSESLLDPGRETLADMANSFHIHPLLVEYFDVTSNACDVYESLLQAVHPARADFLKVKDVITQARGEFDGELSGYAGVKSSLSVVSMDKFRDLHDGYTVLLHNLVNQHHRMNRRTKRLSKVCKKIVEYVSNNIMCSHPHDDGSIRPSLPPTSSRGEELDVAAKLLYVQINDMDTVSRLVGRLQDDATRGKSRAEMAAACATGDLWKGMVKGLGNDGRGFMEQLEELEERICLCLLNINKSRLSVVQEITNNRYYKKVWRHTIFGVVRPFLDLQERCE